MDSVLGYGMPLYSHSQLDHGVEVQASLKGDRGAAMEVCREALAMRSR